MLVGCSHLRLILAMTQWKSCTIPADLNLCYHCGDLNVNTTIPGDFYPQCDTCTKPKVARNKS